MCQSGALTTPARSPSLCPLNDIHPKDTMEEGKDATRTGIIGLMAVGLALVVAGLFLLFAQLGVLVVDLVACLVDVCGADVGRHVRLLSSMML